MQEVMSKDGTKIAFERSGGGPAVILVSGASQDRSGNATLAEILELNFTVFNYDRRGRGDSGDAQPYAVEREVEDIGAVIEEGGGGPASVFGSSSGGNLALLAAAHGLPILKLALWEPNFIVDDARPPLPADYVEQINEMVASDRRGDAVELFMTKAAGMPAEFVAPMRTMPMWPAMEAVAHTLAYDGAIVKDDMTGNPGAIARVVSVQVPTLVMDGGTIPWMSHGAQAVAEALPNGRRRTLEGQPHNVDPDVLAPALEEFFAG